MGFYAASARECLSRGTRKVVGRFLPQEKFEMTPFRYVPESDLPSKTDVFPPYCSGAAFIMRLDQLATLWQRLRRSDLPHITVSVRYYIMNGVIGGTERVPGRRPARELSSTQSGYGLFPSLLQSLTSAEPVALGIVYD